MDLIHATIHFSLALGAPHSIKRIKALFQISKRTAPSWITFKQAQVIVSGIGLFSGVVGLGVDGILLYHDISLYGVRDRLRHSTFYFKWLPEEFLNLSRFSDRLKMLDVVEKLLIDEAASTEGKNRITEFKIVDKTTNKVVPYSEAVYEIAKVLVEDNNKNVGGKKGLKFEDLINDPKIKFTFVGQTYTSS